MHDLNGRIDVSISHAALIRLLESAWHDSAASTAERALKALVDRNAAIHEVVGDRLPLVGDWSHLFDEDGRSVERICQVVLVQDESSGPVRLVALTIQRDNKDRDGTAAEMAEVQKSMEDNLVANDPHEWDIDQDELPTWAADQIHDRIAGNI